jgi:hypothetical protein
MNQLPNNLDRRLLFILHRGLTDIRNLALGEGNEQIADLADALEILPGIIDHWEDDQLEMVRFVLKTYEDKYPGRSFDYLARVEKYDPPDRF